VRAGDTALAPAALHDERHRAHRAVRFLIEQLAASRPVVVALDDLHWADDASLELVAHLLRRPCGGRCSSRSPSVRTGSRRGRPRS
jgi:AAA ATPase-like protein